jgi:DNA-binding NtrC family response regulator
VARILLAASILALPQVSAALADHQLSETTTMQQAEKLIAQDGIDMFVIGIHFDESRSVELVKLIRQNSKYKTTPILMLRVTPSEMAHFIKQTMDAMKHLWSITDYLELEGDPDAAEKIADAVTRYLPSKTGSPR